MYVQVLHIYSKCTQAKIIHNVKYFSHARLQTGMQNWANQQISILHPYSHIFYPLSSQHLKLEYDYLKTPKCNESTPPKIILTTTKMKLLYRIYNLDYPALFCVLLGCSFAFIL